VEGEFERVRVVVGEGDEARAGLLRFVLEGEGFDVVGEASTLGQLAEALAVHSPDVVVLDGGIGVIAVQLTREVSPRAKVVLVWPEGVVTIGADARVFPTEVLRDLGAAVERVLGTRRREPQPAAVRAMPVALLSVPTPDGPERGSDDADEKLHATAGMVLPGPGIDHRTRRDRSDVVIEDRDPAVVLILPVEPDPDRE
jgi:hypothetical protein